MQIPFRQGIIRHSTSPMFLRLANGHVDLVAGNFPTQITFADGSDNYLFSENLDVISAWPGPFNETTWLYWDINVLTGIRTFGSTTIEPVAEVITPIAQSDLHWFDKSTNTMKVYTGSSFVRKIRVFAGKVEQGQIVKVGNSPTGFTGTQVALSTPAKAGYLIFDTSGKPIKKSTGQFFTTESDFITQIPTGNHVRLESIIIEGIAQNNIPAFSAVVFSGFQKIVPASPLLVNVPFGVIEENVTIGQPARVIMEGPITNPNWNWTRVNGFVYCNNNGVISDSPQIADQLPIGTVIDQCTILLRAPRMVLESGLRVNSSDTTRGIVRLSTAPETSLIPIAVGDNDPRMSDARVPLQHNHNVNDITNLQGLLDNKLNLDGGTLHGQLELRLTPSDDLHAVNKQYVDNTFIRSSGGTMSGPLNMNSRRIENVADPLHPRDIVTKNYVDANFMADAGGVMAGVLDMNSHSITNIGVLSATIASGPSILNVSASSTVPSLIPNRADTDTGIGSAGGDALSLVSGGVTALTLIENVGVIFQYQTNTGIVAALASVGQLGATQLTSSVNVISSVRTRGDAVKMPSATPGRRVLIINDTRTLCAIYPFDDDNLGQGANNPVPLPGGGVVEYIAKNNIDWVTV